MPSSDCRCDCTTRKFKIRDIILDEHDYREIREILSGMGMKKSSFERAEELKSELKELDNKINELKELTK